MHANLVTLRRDSIVFAVKCNTVNLCFQEECEDKGTFYYCSRNSLPLKISAR